MVRSRPGTCLDPRTYAGTGLVSRCLSGLVSRCLSGLGHVLRPPLVAGLFWQWPGYGITHCHNAPHSTALLHPTGINMFSNTSVLAIGIPLVCGRVAIACRRTPLNAFAVRCSHGRVRPRMLEHLE